MTQSENTAINLDILGQELADIKPVDPNDYQLDAVMVILMGIDTKQEASHSINHKYHCLLHFAFKNIG